MKILVIEDSRFLRTALERALANAGHEATSIADGREAFMAAHRGLPALILPDMMLSGLDGTGVLKELKQNASTPHIPVSVLTGLSQKNETKLRKGGAAAYIEKSPLEFVKNAETLFHAIASMLGTGEVLAKPEHQSLSTADAETATTETRVGNPVGASMMILLAEDSALYRHLITGHLAEWGFDCICVKDGLQAWDVLAKPDAPRLALLDWVLPGVDGVELCRRLRLRPETEPYTYTILLTAKSQKQEMLEAMEAGADDFLAKPFDPPELKARLLVGKRIVELQQKLMSANGALHYAASHDFLTKLWNRAAIITFLQRELARALREGLALGVILVDVDHFKKVNDELGHETGDYALQEIAQRFSSSLREYDGVGRYGGEEFLLVMPGCDRETTVRRANVIRELISSQPIRTPLRTTTVTVSMGVAVAEPTSNSEALLRRADLALYQAKRNGRNRVEETTTATAQGS
ncbi:MAG TPA: diguanylate cyclase [Candidatus Dormibacteraeota bacterium]|nr:diguanylate cyclase [Candidatus Dormibacteraeota bacterium]